MKIKNGYPPIGAYREVFGSFTDALLAWESDEEIDTEALVDIDQLAKYTEICQNKIYELSLQFPYISVNDITKLFQEGYLIGIDAATENIYVHVLQEEFL